MKKRSLSLLLAALLLLAACPPSALADGDVISVRTPSDWASLAKNCVLDTWSKDKTVVLEADLDLSGGDGVPIPLFAGRFDGGGHTVSGFLLDADASVTGLFRRVLPGGVVENLNVEGRVAPGGTADSVGGVAGENGGTIRDCGFSGTVKGSRAVGGIAGVNASGGVIENCAVSGTVSGSHRVGGIAGENAGLVGGCENRAAVNTGAPPDTGTESLRLTLGAGDASLSAEELADIADIGGVAGFSSGAVAGCVNTGAVGYLSTGYNVGGVVGRLSGYAENCRNVGAVRGRRDVGGVVGQLDPDARWSFDGGILAELREMVAELRRRADTLSSDAGAMGAQVSADMSGVLDAISRTEAAAEAAAGAAGDWIGGALETVNGAASLGHDLIAGLVPVAEALGDFADALPDFTEALAAALSGLSGAAEDLGPGFAGIAAALGGGDAAVEGLRSAASEVGAAAAHLRAALSDPAAAAEALRELSAGLNDLASALLKLAAGETDSLAEASEALGDLAGELSALAGLLDPDELSQSLTSLQNSLSGLASALAALRNANNALRDALDAFGAFSGALARGLDLSATASETLDGALAALRRASGAAEALIDALSERETLRFDAIDPLSGAREELFDSLRAANDALGALSGDLDGGTLKDDLQAVSDQLFAILDHLMAALEGAGTDADPDYVEDVSAGESARTDATVALCVNRGDVSADTNAGGVAGAVTLDISFDREDALDLSSLLSGGAKYLIYAVLRDCENSASVTAKKDAAGGIAGRMDYGAAIGCDSAGAVSAAGNYAGGIAGLCRGALLRCRARTNLSAGNYAGGIAGFGHDVRESLAMPNVASGAEFSGSIAGDADGAVEDNYFAGSALGGVNGFSFSGRAEEISYEALLSLSDGAELFRTITVSFVVEGETVAAVAVPFGGSVSGLPEVPDKDGKFWKWDDIAGVPVYHSMTVTGAYHSPLTTLATAEDPPLVLVEGSFYEGQALAVTPLSPAGLPGIAEEDVLAAYSIGVGGYGGDLTVRLRAEPGGTLYVLNGDGSAEPHACERDGSYLVFDLPNGGSVVYAASPRGGVPWAAIGAGGGAAVLAAAALLLRRSRKKKKAPVSGA